MKVVALFGGWSVLLIGISAYISRLVAERVQSQWRRQEQSQLETLKSDLADNRLLLDTAVQRQAAGGDLAQQRRLDAVMALWEAMLVLRRAFPVAFVISDIFLPEEYDSAIGRGSEFGEAALEITDQSVHSVIMSADSIELTRPLIGEALWLYFFVYRAFVGRAAHLLRRGAADGRLSGWHADDGIRQLLAAAIPTDRLNALYADDPPLGFLNRAARELETLVLREIAIVVSGERSSLESFDIASRLRNASSAAASGV